MVEILHFQISTSCKPNRNQHCTPGPWHFWNILRRPTPYLQGSTPAPSAPASLASASVWHPPSPAYAGPQPGKKTTQTFQPRGGQLANEVQIESTWCSNLQNISCIVFHPGVPPTIAFSVQPAPPWSSTHHVSEDQLCPTEKAMVAGTPGWG